MTLSGTNQPWYVAGLAFECLQCGRCCTGPDEGYVWVTNREITILATFLAVTPEEVRRRYARREGGRCTIVENPRTHDCVFLTGQAGGPRGCQVYSARPAQCSAWPFWPLNLASPERWAMAAKRCPGVNRGRIFSYQEIQERSRPPVE